MSAKFPKDTTNTLQPESGELFEEMSGMVTLKRKAKEKGNGVSSRPESPYRVCFNIYILYNYCYYPFH